jgi:hypothetical protein
MLKKKNKMHKKLTKDAAKFAKNMQKICKKYIDLKNIYLYILYI